MCEMFPPCWSLLLITELCLPCSSSFPKLQEAAGHQLWQEQWNSFNQHNDVVHGGGEGLGGKKDAIRVHWLYKELWEQMVGWKSCSSLSEKWVRDTIFN